MKKKETRYKAHYNPDRECYISADGKYLCYNTTDLETRRPITLRYEIGKNGITEELTFQIDEINYEHDLNDCYESELRDPLFDAKVNSYKADSDNEDMVDPWDTIPNRSGSPEDALFAEPEPENPQTVEVCRIIDEECTDSQQDFYFAHFGEGKQLEEMRQDEAKQTGKLPSSAAFTNRKNKIIDKVAKVLGVERVKRHSYPSKKDKP